MSRFRRNLGSFISGSSNTASDKDNGETNELWESIFYLPVLYYKKELIIRAAMGNIDGNQALGFSTSITQMERTYGNFSDNYRIEIIDNNSIRKYNWSPKDLVDWLLGSHIHFIITHVHQGHIVKGLKDEGWDIVNLCSQLKRLKLHNGFPNNNKLWCPIFTQDKYEYIKACPGFCIPTIKIEVVCNDHFYNEEIFVSKILR